MEISYHGKHLNLPNAKMSAAGTFNSESVKANKNGMTEGIGESQTQRLIDRLQGSSDVRNRLLVEVKAKVMSGEYNTRTAIEKAAERMIDS